MKVMLFFNILILILTHEQIFKLNTEYFTTMRKIYFIFLS
jgi:hypothetical protein